MKKTMKALNLCAVGDLRLEELPVPQTGDDEVLVKIAYCGVCGSDIPRVFSKGTYHFPTVIGHEFSGTVEFDPTGELTGKRVAVFPLLPCFECESCRAENYALCSNYDYYGSRRDGGMAEYLAVKRWNILELPDSVSLEAGAMCEPSAVACHALRKLGDLTGKSLLISGAGPIGLIAAMWAKNKGAEKVYFFDIDERKVEAARALGFYEYEEGACVDLCIEGTGTSPGAPAGAGYYARLVVYVNGKKCLASPKYSDSRGFYPQVKLIRFKGGKSLLYIHYSTSNGYYAGGWVYRCSPTKGTCLLKTESLVTAYNKAHPSAWRCYESLASVKGSAVSFKIGSSTTAATTYTYRYSSGKLTRI